MVRKIRTVGAVGVGTMAGVEEQAVLGLDPVVLSQRVQRGAELNAVIKDLEKELKELKAGLMANAIETGEIEFVSDSGDRLTVTPSSSTEVSSVKDFVRLLKKLGKSQFVNDLLKVELTKVKAVLGEDVLKQVATTTTKKFGKLTFKMAGRNLAEVKRSILA